MSTVCGYNKNGVAVSAISGHTCKFEPSLGLWGVCTTAAPVCDLNGVCFDDGPCSTGCGTQTDNTNVATIHCNVGEPLATLCATQLLVDSASQTLDFLFCSRVATTQTIFAPVVATTFVSSTSLLSNPSGPITSAPRITTTPRASIAKTTSTSTAPQPQFQSTRASSSTPAIVGGVVGGVVAICLTILIIFFIWRRRKGPRGGEAGNGREEHQDQAHDTSDPKMVAAQYGSGGEIQELDLRTQPVELSADEYTLPQEMGVKAAPAEMSENEKAPLEMDVH